MEATFTSTRTRARSFKGRIRQIRNAPQTVQNVVTYDAVIDVANPDLKLKPGHDRQRDASSTPSGGRAARAERRPALPAHAGDAERAGRSRGPGPARAGGPSGSTATAGGGRRGPGGGPGRRGRRRGSDGEDGPGAGTEDGVGRSSDGKPDAVAVTTGVVGRRR